MKMDDAERSQNAEQVALETMTGDLRDLMLQEIREGLNGKRPWSALSQGEQSEIVIRCEMAVIAAVEKAVRIIASDNNTCISAIVESLTAKDGVKVVLKAARTTETLGEIGMAVGSPVMVIITETEKYKGQRADPEVDPDEPELDIPHADDD